jgi:MoaA/NifB/PqqE/SkfB family radical SAM enzyme
MKARRLSTVIGLNQLKSAAGFLGLPVMETVDPAVDQSWPLALPEFSVVRMKDWTEAVLRDHLRNDRLFDNLILNKYEFAKGITTLRSYPWRLSVPFILCNARCDFCSAWLVRGETLPLEFIESLIPTLRHCYEIDMVGWGEPLIHPELGAIIDIIKREVDPRARISLTTNGIKLLDWADRLLDANVISYAISMHAASAATHNDVMGMGLQAFDKICAGIRYLAEQKRQRLPKAEVTTAFIVMRQNIAEIPEYLTLCQDLGVESVFFRTLKPVDDITPGLDYHRLPPYLHEDFTALRDRAVAAIADSPLRIVATPETWSTPIFPETRAAEFGARPATPREERGQFIQKIQRIDERTDLPAGDLDPAGIPAHPADNPYSRTPPMRCPSPYTAFYINGFDRAVSPCCYMTQVPGHQMMHYSKGMPFDRIWNSPAMVNLRKALHGGPLMDPCLKCPFYW